MGFLLGPTRGPENCVIIYKIICYAVGWIDDLAIAVLPGGLGWRHTSAGLIGHGMQVG
jgi:hypothetical protein